MSTETAFVTILLTTITIGLGCGIGCGSMVTPFIITRLLGERKNPEESFKALLFFISGKISTLVLLGLATSLIGREVISVLSDVLPVDMGHLFGIGCIVFGLVLILSRVLRRCRCSSGCSNCIGTDEPTIPAAFSGMPSYYLSGVLYALTPCPPLTVVLISAAVVSPVQAIAVMVSFGAASSLTPLLLIAPLTGILTQKMVREIPRLTGILQSLSGCLLIVLGVRPFFMPM